MIWLRTLSKTQRNALLGTGTGWAVDGFDFVLYSLLVPTLIGEWGMTRGQAGLIATAALLTSALGGWLGGLLADRWGRVKVLQLTILWFSVFTFLSGLTNSFPQLATVRALQGLGFGGEWAVGAVLLSEMMGPVHRAKAVGLMQSGYAIGWAFATGAYTALFSWLPVTWAWRTLFFLGILPALLIVFLRARVAEPEVFLAARLAQPSQRRSVFEIFSRPSRRILALASLLAVGIQGAYYAVVTWLPTYLSTVRHLSVLGTGSQLLILIAGSFFGYLSGSASMDRFGRRRTFIAFAVLSAVTSSVYFSAPLPDSLVSVAGFPLGFTISGMISGMGAFLAELFPTGLRASAQGFAYNFGRVVAASFPPLIGTFSGTYSLASMTWVFALGSFACVIVAVALLPETYGRSLDSASA